MNTSQMLITIGAMFLLGLVILRVNAGFLSTSGVLMDSKIGLLATSLATSIIEEANGKAFDQNTDTNSVSDLDSLSIIGPDSGEVYPDFNDFDDFDGLSIMDSSLASAVFNISSEVVYINALTPDAAAATKTWHKKITVSVTSVSMEDTIELSSIFSYFHHR